MCIYSVFSVSCRLQQNNERYHQQMYFLFIVHHIHNISYNLFTQYSKKIYTFNILFVVYKNTIYFFDIYIYIKIKLERNK